MTNKKQPELIEARKVLTLIDKIRKVIPLNEVEMSKKLLDRTAPYFNHHYWFWSTKEKAYRTYFGLRGEPFMWEDSPMLHNCIAFGLGKDDTLSAYGGLWGYLKEGGLAVFDIPLYIPNQNIEREEVVPCLRINSPKDLLGFLGYNSIKSKIDYENFKNIYEIHEGLKESLDGILKGKINTHFCLLSSGTFG